MTLSTTKSEEYKVPNDWRGIVLSHIRLLIQQVDSEISEEIKYKTASNPAGVLVWYKQGMICTGEIYKKHLRFTFSKGQLLKEHDPKSLINSYRAMIIQEDDQIDDAAFKELMREAVKLNQQAKSKKSK